MEQPKMILKYPLIYINECMCYVCSMTVNKELDLNGVNIVCCMLKVVNIRCFILKGVNVMIDMDEGVNIKENMGEGKNMEEGVI
ncbi:hypothetical protein CWI38_0026p0030 [Hamiltosporidium tvaerminnensis]|uniref:Uncharacterized protein n=1 Tax=Hamiltosporidium tvaerminnensis TaxID=1176355 RepID=A0A4V2JYD4_9MICR|nr:hypothetical protein CWI38_0026p0030 [Hamiltosporidium tvaerminnensis]